MTGDDGIIASTIAEFRQREIEKRWEALDRPDVAAYEALWQGLEEVGLPLLALPEQRGGLELSAAARHALLSELGAGSPALAVGLIQHLVAQGLVCAARPALDLPADLALSVSEGRLSHLGNLLEDDEDPAFVVDVNGAMLLGGRTRVALPPCDQLSVPVWCSGERKLAVVPRDAAGLEFAAQTSSHGLRLLPFGTLTADAVRLDPERLLQWPDTGAVRALADGLLASLITGMVQEMADRAMAYALERYQGGKMIHEHDAVRELVAPLLLASRALRSLAIETLASTGPGDGGASAYAIEQARSGGLDAIQTFGGYGYMEDYRVERYMRDANTIETFFVHASKRRRSIAAARFGAMAL